MRPGSYTGAILGQRPRYPYIANQDSSQWDRLHMWFPFEVALGDSQVDLAGVRTGTLSTGNSYVSHPLLGHELDFSGTDSVWEASGTMTPPTVGTASFWLKTSTVGILRLMGLDTVFEVRILADGTLANEFRVVTAGLGSTIAVNDGVLRHCTLTWDSDVPRQKIYLDGVLDATRSNTGGAPATQAFSVGHITTGGGVIYTGQMADLKMWFDREFTDADAWQLFDPPTRWELAYELYRIFYSFPPAVVVDAFIPAGSDMGTS